MREASVSQIVKVEPQGVAERFDFLSISAWCCYESNAYEKTFSFVKSLNDNSHKSMQFVLFGLIYGNLFWLNILFIFVF